jgi:hypothetical protein
MAYRKIRDDLDKFIVSKHILNVSSAGCPTWVATMVILAKEKIAGATDYHRLPFFGTGREWVKQA